MALKMQLDFPATGEEAPAAYGAITDATILMAQGVTQAIITWWWDEADDQLQSIRTDNVAFTPQVLNMPNPAFVVALQAQITNGKIVSAMDALKAALYILATQQPAYGNAENV